jgi:hypothetical protein
MSKLVELYEKQKPLTAQANLKGGDKTLIEADGGLDLSKDETALKRARGGELNTTPYTSVVNAE